MGNPIVSLSLAAFLLAVGGCAAASGPATPAAARMESWWDDGDPTYRYPVLTYADLLLWPPNTTTGGVYVGERYWVWPYNFRQGPPPYVPRVTTW